MTTQESITTERLTLVPATIPSLMAELEGNASISRQLGVEVPENWPPELYDAPAIEWTIKFLEEKPEGAKWCSWYMLLRNGEVNQHTLIGIVGLKGMPLDDGTAEVGYSVLQQYQRQGYATEAASALRDWALSHDEVTRVIAETLPELVASQRVLEKSGFHFIGPGSEEGVIQYEYLRPS
jgi:[ribosomal protein S5]-alanine N-acetyltransferase